MRRTVMKGLLGLGATAAAGRAAWAQPFPSKQIRLIVGFPPGGGLDNLARLLSERMAQDLGQSLLIDNRPGAGGGIASAELLRAPADGHTIVLGNVGQFSVLEHLSPNPIAGFPSRVAAIGQIGNAPLGLFVPASLPVTDLRGFIAYVKAGGGKYNYGSGGSGQITHLAVEMLKQQAGLALTHVPYKGSAASVTDLIGGRIEAIIDALGVGVPHVKSGKLKLLAVTAAERLADYPDVPTVRESGVPDYGVSGWQGLVAPAGTPAEVVRRLNASLNAALKSPDIAARMWTLGYLPAPGTPEAFAALMRDESTRWANLIRAAKIQAQ